jgi:release factor glutamine methyltransferase
VTITDALKHAVAQLESKDIAGAHLDAELLLAHILDKPRTWVHAHSESILTNDQVKAFETFITQRLNHTPVVHLTGTREFYGLDFEITPDVLTPRVETETMVEWAIRYAPTGGRLIDIGTGSGAIAVAIGAHRPDLAITATDITGKELSVARRNATTHHVNIELIESDLWTGVAGSYDVVVTNLPYLRIDADLMPEVTKEPAVALFGGPDGLDLYRRFLKDIGAHLKPGGYLFTECDPWQHDALMTEAATYGLKTIEQGYFILGFRLA